MRDYYRVYANIDLDAIYENVVNAKKLTKPGTKLMAIIKADAYGHGAVEVAMDTGRCCRRLRCCDPEGGNRASSGRH